MAPTSQVARSGWGLSITSVSVKKGKPTVVKYSWKYKDNSPEYFVVGIIELSSHEFTMIDYEVETRGHGGNGKGTNTVSIEALKNHPGKYVLVFVEIEEYNTEYATSKAFQVKKSDF